MSAIVIVGTCMIIYHFVQELVRIWRLGSLHRLGVLCG